MKQKKIIDSEYESKSHPKSESQRIKINIQRLNNSTHNLISCCGWQGNYHYLTWHWKEYTSSMLTNLKTFLLNHCGKNSRIDKYIYTPILQRSKLGNTANLTRNSIIGFLFQFQPNYEMKDFDRIIQSKLQLEEIIELSYKNCDEIEDLRFKIAEPSKTEEAARRLGDKFTHISNY